MKYDPRLAFQKEEAIFHFVEHINLLIAPNKVWYKNYDRSFIYEKNERKPHIFY